MRPFYYEGVGGSKSFCGLEVIASGADSATVILTELPGNPGTPVREFFAELATIIYKSRLVFLKIAPERVVWIDVVPPAASKGVYLKRISVSSTMGPGVPVDQASLGA